MDEEKKGFFGKIQEKVQEFKKAAGQKQAETLDDKKRKVVDEVIAFMNKGLRDLVDEPVEFKPFTVGEMFGIVGGFTTKDNVPVTTYIAVRSSGSLYYPMEYIFGSFADRPVPVSMIAKKISTGFARSERVLIPYNMETRFNFDAKTLWKNKTSWNPLIEAMNKDKQMISALSILPNEAVVSLSSKMYSTYKIWDENEKDVECLCQIIPYKNLTFIGIRTLRLLQESQVKNIVNMFRLVRWHILGYGHAGPTDGPVAQDWINLPIFLMTEFFPPVKQVFPPEPTVEVDQLVYFGEKRDRAMQLVKVFKSTIRDEPENLNALVTIRQRLVGLISQDSKILLEALNSSEASVQAAAATALRSYPESNVIAALKEVSESPDILVACSALESLGALGKKELTPFLMRFLNDSVAQKRVIAAFVLSQLEDERVVDALSAALNDEETRVQKIAAFGLLKIRVKQIQEDRVDKAIVEEALKKFFGYLDLNKLVSMAKGEEKDVKIDVKDIYPGQVTAEILKLLFRRFLVVVKAHKEELTGRKEQSFSYLVDAESDEEAGNKVVEEFNKQQGKQGFVVDSRDKPLDMTAIGADASKEYPLGLLIQPMLMKDKK